MDSTETQAATQKNDIAPRTVTLRNKIGYAMGDVGNNFLFDMGQLYLLNYFTDQVGFPAQPPGRSFWLPKSGTPSLTCQWGPGSITEPTLVNAGSSGRSYCGPGFHSACC